MSTPSTRPAQDLIHDASSQAAGKPPTTKPTMRIWLYATTLLALLTVGFIWLVYQQRPTLPIKTPYPTTTNLTQGSTASVVIAAATLAASSAPASLVAVTQVATTIDVPAPTCRPSIQKKQARAPQLKKHKLTKHLIISHPLKEAYLALSLGHLDLAKQKYLTALHRHPHEKDALLGLAVIAQHKLQLSRAANLYKQVLREDMDNAAAAAGLVSLSAQTTPIAAESQLRELLDIKPGSPEIQYALGNVLAHQHRWGEAQQVFFRALNLQPDNALYTYNLAVSLDHMHQPVAALAYYKKAATLAKFGVLNLTTIKKRIQELNSK
ncbi:MAG: tetratricopeptide repeat protein [Gallionella sp.]